NINTLEQEIIPMPIDTVSLDGQFATSFSYERLEEHMPGYGYCHSDEYSFMGEKQPSETGLFLIDLKTKALELVVDLKTLGELSRDLDSSNEWDHYVTHTEFSHDSKLIS